MDSLDRSRSPATSPELKFSSLAGALLTFPVSTDPSALPLPPISEPLPLIQPPLHPMPDSSVTLVPSTGQGAGRAGLQGGEKASMGGGRTDQQGMTGNLDQARGPAQGTGARGWRPMRFQVSETIPGKSVGHEDPSSNLSSATYKLSALRQVSEYSGPWMFFIWKMWVRIVSSW